MKKILLALLIASQFLASPVFAVTNSHSTDLERTSNQFWSILDVAQTGLDPAGDFTFMVYLKPESQPSSGQPNSIYSKYLGTGNQRSIWIYYENPSGTARFSINLSSLGTTVFTGTINKTLTNATWYQFSMVFTSSTGVAEIFIDGTSIGTVSSGIGNIFDGIASARIGGEPDADGFKWDGLMDDFMFFNNDLVESDIDAYIADECSWSPPASLQLRALFNNDGLDETANNNDLTNNNIATFSTDVAYTCAAAAAGTVVEDIIWFNEN